MVLHQVGLALGPSSVHAQDRAQVRKRVRRINPAWNQVHHPRLRCKHVYPLLNPFPDAARVVTRTGREEPLALLAVRVWDFGFARQEHQVAADCDTPVPEPQACCEILHENGGRFLAMVGLNSTQFA